MVRGRARVSAIRVELRRGATWTSPIQISPPAFFGIDGLGVGAGVSASEGDQVVVSYHVNTTMNPNATSATWLFTQVSVDGGRTWNAPQLAAPTGLSAVACSMCQTRPRFANGMLLIAFRSAVANVRDFYVLRGSALANAFTPTRINSDGWVLHECPMNGPELTLGDTTMVAAFMTDDANHVYWSASASAAGPFSGHVPTPAHEANERYPTAVSASNGDVLMVWNVGPMAVEGTALVKYACFAGTAVTQDVTIGTSFAGTKATAVVVGPGSFLLLTTAR